MLPSRYAVLRGGHHPQPNQSEGESNEVNPEAAGQEHTKKTPQRRSLGYADPDEEQCRVRTRKDLRRGRRQRSPSNPGDPSQRHDPDEDDRRGDPRIVFAFPGSNQAQREEEKEEGGDEPEERAPKSDQTVWFRAPRTAPNHRSGDRDCVPPRPFERQPPARILLIRHGRCLDLNVNRGCFHVQPIPLTGGCRR